MRKAKDKKASFVIEIRYMQHSSWQGIVKWLDSEEEICFRSSLELLKILDSVRKAVVVDTEFENEDASQNVISLLG